MKASYKSILIALLLLFQFPLWSQWPAPRDTRFIVSGVPQYILLNAVRIDFDIRSEDSNKWWVLSPYYYSSHASGDYILSNESYHNYEGMIGGGLGIERRIFISREAQYQGLYLSFGATYKYFNIWNSEYITFDGSTYDIEYMYEPEPKTIKYDTDIHSIRGSAIMGFQKEVMPSLFFDFYLGFGIQYSHHVKPAIVESSYDERISDFGYTGTLLIGGVRIGVGIN